MAIVLDKLFDLYERMANLVEESNYLKSDFAKIQTVFEEKRQNLNINVMVYGVYNSGKSTLINALLGEEKAEVDDIPKTDSVTSYACGSFAILDTPGVDAPIAHENVTKEQMLKADVIIFVVNPVGVAEEKKTMTVLLDLLEKGKQVFLVFNDKDQLSQEDFFILKNQTWEILQKMAIERGLTNILQAIPTVRVNAKSALKAKLENKKNLLERSGFIHFEQKLNDFINERTEKDIERRLSMELQGFIEKFIQTIEENSTAELVKKYDKLILDVGDEKVNIKNEMYQLIDNEKREAYHKAKFILHSQIEEANQSIKDYCEKRCAFINNQLNDKIEKSYLYIQKEVELFQLEMFDKAEGIEEYSVSALNIMAEQDVDTKMLNEIKEYKLNDGKIMMIASAIPAVIKPEHITSTLKVLKTTFPSILGKLSNKTIEKIAGSIPLIGTVTTIGLGLRDMLKDDEETIALQKQKEQHLQAMERQKQMIEDMALSISQDFAYTLLNYCNEHIETCFIKIIDIIQNFASEFNEKDQKNNAYLREVNNIKQDLLYQC